MRKSLFPAVLILTVAALLLAGCSATVAPKSAATSADKPSAAPMSKAKMSMDASMSGDMKKPEKTIEGDAAIEGDVQKVSIDLSTGQYAPNRITAKAGVPLEITFGQGKGCVKKLVFPSFKIEADMTTGAKTFKLGALAPGEYKWHCGMDMKHGVIIVK